MIPRRSVLMGAALGLGLAAQGQPLWADEGGEAGEGAAIAGLPETVEFLTLLGLFEAQHRIVAALYAAGEVEAAQAHLAESHHAAYDDIEAGIAATGVPKFEDEVANFATAVTSGAEAAAVQAAADKVLSALDAVRHSTGDKDQMKAAEALLRVAASDMEAGVENGQVTLAQEYRDAWGFATVAQLWLDDLAADANPTVAEAAKAALSGRADVEAQFAGVGASAAPGDPGALLAAAARVELSAYRLE